MVLPRPVTLASVSLSPVRQLAQDRFKLLPSDTEPPPPRGPLVLIVTELFDKELLPILVRVLEAPEIVLFDKLSDELAVIYPLLFVHCEILALVKFDTPRPDRPEPSPVKEFEALENVQAPVIVWV